MSASELPPLAAIRVFEAAARHLSFTRAADELGMTQAAVSYQIKVLEERVGAPLFLRRPRQVGLTETGAHLLPAVSDAFRQLRTAYAEARGVGSATLVISTVLTFASNWLSRRIGSFQIANAGLSVRIETASHVVDFSREEVDVGIRSGSGDWPGVTAHLLFAADFTPMLAPALAARVSKPADLLDLTLLDPADPWWKQWFAASGVGTEGLAGRPDTRLGSQSYEASAAIAGQGAAILTRAFYEAELAEGRLVQPFDLVCSDGQAYWLAYPEARRNVPKIRAFRDWLLAEVAATGPGRR